MIRKFQEKTALITGSREGIGFQTAMQLASRNWKIIMVDNKDLNEAKGQIAKKTSNQKLYAHYVDLACFKSIRTLTKEIYEKYDQLDVLINNAGIFQAQVDKTEDNLNTVMQVNHFGPFLLTCLLKDLLIRSTSSRTIFLSSMGAFMHTLDYYNLPMSDIQDYTTNILTPTFTYYNSKLCNMIISKELARRLQPYGVTSNCLHPGMTSSNFLLKEMDILKYISPFAHKMVQFTAQDVETSAQMVTFLATSRSLMNITGQYFTNYQISKMPKILYNSEYCKNIWSQAEKIVNLLDNEKIV